MPDLPTLTVTDPQAARVLSAFQGQTDENGAAMTPVQAYRRWLRDTLRGHVLAVEERRLDAGHITTKEAALISLRNELP